MNFLFLKRYGYEDPILLLTAFSLLNFSMHIFNNYFDLKEDSLTGQTVVMKSKSVLLLLGSGSLFISFAMVVYYGFSIPCFLILLALMLSYSVPVGKKNLRLKNILFLKNITGSLFWWYLPFVIISSFHTDNSFIDLFVSNLLVLATFMPFEPLWDIKDMDGDLAAGVNTIPNKYGVDATRILVISCFGIMTLVRLSTWNLSALTLFVPLMVFTVFIKKDTPVMAYQLMMLLLPAHIIISLLIE